MTDIYVYRHGEIQRETDISVIYIFLQHACIHVHRERHRDREKNSNIVNKKINDPIEKWAR